MDKKKLQEFMKKLQEMAEELNAIDKNSEDKENELHEELKIIKGDKKGDWVKKVRKRTK